MGWAESIQKRRRYIKSDYTKFKEIYDEIDCLIKNRVSSSTPEFQAWKVKTERFLIKKYGEKSYEFKNFKLDQATLQLFEAFRNRNFIVDGESVPIDKYFVVDRLRSAQLSE